MFGALLEWWQRLPFPAVAPRQNYALPPELGGLIATYPIWPDRRHFGGLNELRTNWQQTIVEGQNVGYPQYYGDVYSIQDTARPGYYVPGEVLYEIGWNGLPADQEGPFG